MKVIATEIPDVLVLEPKLLGDQRGFFLEAFHNQRYAEHGILGPFVQDNLSRSGFGVIRGLHLQNPSTQGKLVSVLRGQVLDVAVDVRVGSPTFGRHVVVELNEQNRRQLWVPRGFAHALPFFLRRLTSFISATILMTPTTRSLCAGMTQQSVLGGISKIQRCRRVMRKPLASRMSKTCRCTVGSNADPLDWDKRAGRRSP